MESLFKKRQERIALFRRLQRKNVRPTVLKEIPEFIYQHCPSCQSTLVNQELIDHKYVCPHCQHHFNLSANERIRQVCDLGSFVEIDKNAKTSNQEKFIGYDQKSGTRPSTNWSK